MSTDKNVKIDERTVAVLNASNTWSINFIFFALLIDIYCRSVFFHEAAWDLFALIGVCGAIQMVYLARHKVLGQVYGWKKVAIHFAVVAFVVGLVVFILAMTKAR